MPTTNNKTYLIGRSTVLLGIFVLIMATSNLAAQETTAATAHGAGGSFLGLTVEDAADHDLWEGPTDYRVALKPIGRVRAIMLFAHFPDTTKEETTEALYDWLVPDGIAYFKRASYGKMAIEVDALNRWLPMDHPTTWPNYDCSKFDTQKAYLQEAITKSASEVDFKKYDIVYVVGSLGPGHPNSPTFGASPGNGVQINGTEIRHAVTFGNDCRGDRWGWQTLAHETGHICGLPDLYKFGAPNKPYKGIHVYVGSWDLMGFQAPGSEYLAWQKRKLLWLSDRDFALVPKTARMRASEFWLTPIGKKGGRKAAVAPISSAEAYVCEVRCRSDNPESGVLLYRVSLSAASGHGPIQVISAAPDDNNPATERRYITLYNALYRDGVVLDDTRAHVRIEIVGRKPDGEIRVRVIR